MNIKKILYFLLLCWCVNSVFAAAPDNQLSQFLKKSHYTVLPLNKNPNAPVLWTTIHFNAKKSEIYIVDPGSETNYVDKGVAAQYKFAPTGKVVVIKADGKIFKLYEVAIPKIQFSNFSVTQIKALAKDLSFVKLNNQQVAGFIGLNFLRQHYAILDIANHRLFLQVSPSKDAMAEKNQLRDLLAQGYTKIQLARAPQGQQTLMARINNHKSERFMLSGIASNIVLSAHYANQIKLPRTGPVTIGKDIYGQPTKNFPVAIRSFAVNQFRQIPSTPIATTGLRVIKIGVPIQGVLGITWISDQVLMDFVSDLLFVKS